MVFVYPLICRGTLWIISFPRFEIYCFFKVLSSQGLDYCVHLFLYCCWNLFIHNVCYSTREVPWWFWNAWRNWYHWRRRLDRTKRRINYPQQKRKTKWPYSDNRRIFNHIINKLISELKVTILKVKYYFIVWVKVVIKMAAVYRIPALPTVNDILRYLFYILGIEYSIYI